MFLFMRNTQNNNYIFFAFHDKFALFLRKWDGCKLELNETAIILH